MATDIQNSFNNITNSSINLVEKEQIPNQLSTDLSTPSNFVGREDELNEIESMLDKSNSLLLINGIGGVGKSAIASYYLTKNIDSKDDNYYGFFEGIGEFISQLQSSLKLKPSSDDNKNLLDVLARLRNLKGNKILVIDDIKDIESNKDKIKKILGLVSSSFKILLTSREEIEGIPRYELSAMNMQDAKRLFSSIYKVEDEDLLEDILKYLDCHTLFVEMTAKTLKNKGSLTLQDLKDKFDNGEFAKVSIKRRESFNDHLNKRFNFDNMDTQEILTLKQLSILHSKNIDFQDLKIIFESEDEELEEILEYLVEKGWLTKNQNSYKLHQIIKEYILSNHAPQFSEIEGIIEYFTSQIPDSSDIQVAINNRDILEHLQSIDSFLQKIDMYRENIAAFHDKLGNIYCHLGEYSKAELPLKRAIIIRAKIFGEAHHGTAASYNNLAVLYQAMGKYDKALPFNKKSLEIAIKTFGRLDSSTASSYNNIAYTYHKIKKYDKALTKYKASLEICNNVFGKLHSKTATTYNNIGSLYETTGRFDKALEYFNKSLEIKEKILGKSHADTALSYRNLSGLYERQKNYEKAYSLAIKAIDILEKDLPLDHPILVSAKKSLNNINKKLKLTK